MPDLSFQVVEAKAVPFAVAPLLAFGIQVSNTGGETVHTVALRCQIQIEVVRRRYGQEEQARLQDLFGDPDRWAQTLRTMLWTHSSVIVPSFSGSTLVDLHVPCTFDFNVAAVKYFHGLEGGEIPLCLQFSGTVFYERDGLQAAPISWDKEAKFRLPVKIWRDMIETYYPNSAWLNLRRDVFERLYQYKVRTGIPTWEQMLEGLLEDVEEGVRT